MPPTDPTNAARQGDLATTFSNLGGLWQVEGSLAAARRAYDDALAIRKRLAEADPTKQPAKRCDAGSVSLR